jgi:type VI secretion system protein ImpG
MFNKYYEDELAFLREAGAEFARAHPAAAPMLAGRGSDPDVERVLEGFAFLSGRLRQKLDDELPEVVQSLLQLLVPHYLRPIPAATIVEFEPLPQMVREPMTIPRGAEIASIPIDGTSCRFRTSSAVRVLPLKVTTVALERPAGSLGTLRVAFQVSPSAKAAELAPERMRFWLSGEPAASAALFLQLTRRLRGVIVRAPGPGAPSVTLPPDAVTAAGTADDEALLPWPAHALPAYRLVQEYFAFPQKFLFVDVAGLPPLAALSGTSTFEIVFDFAAAQDAALRVGPESLRLHCTPAVNLFAAESEPLRVDHERVEYLVRPAGVPSAHGEVYAVDSAQAWVRGTAEPRELPSFHSFRHETGVAPKTGLAFYRVRLRESVIDRRGDAYVSFVTGSGTVAELEAETVVLGLTVTNRALAGSLRVGDVTQATDESPPFARFRNVVPVTPGVPPPLGGELEWRLLSNLALNQRTLADADALRELLGVYNFRALHDRQAGREAELRISGVRTLRATPEERLYHGAPIRGIRVDVELVEEAFGGEGGMVLFGGVLSDFLALHATLNSFTRLVVRGAQHGEEYAWSPRLGARSLV